MNVTLTHHTFASFAPRLRVKFTPACHLPPSPQLAHLQYTAIPVMSSSANSYFFRRRTIGRAASPPTWACYEQIPYDGDEDSDSVSDSCSEDEDEYPPAAASQEPMSDSDEVDHAMMGDNVN